MDPLFIFMDLEAAHGNVYFGDIIEIAAQVDPRVLINTKFTRLVHTNQNLSYFVLKVCKISPSMLVNEKPFAEVFGDFLKWIRFVVKRSNKTTKNDFYPVLVAHGGFEMDFMMIQSNMERNEMNLDVLVEYNIHFADTYHLVKKARLDGLIGCLCGSKLSIEALFKRLYPQEPFEGQHRALADVKFMVKIFIKSKIKDIFDRIDVATFESRSEVFYARHTSVSETKTLDKYLPKDLSKVNHTMTLRRLLRNGITYDQLQILFRNSISFIDFFDRLNLLGIDRKSAKSIALQLTNMGLMCSGEIIKETRNEVGDEDDNLKEAGQAGFDKKDEVENSRISRTDSGYELNPSSEFNLQLFYDMFVDEFFYPPETYEYFYGDFTLQEIEELDDYIAVLFETRFPEYFDDDAGESKEAQNLLIVDDVGIIKNCEEFTENEFMTKYDENENDAVVPNEGENWDEELPEHCEEFLIPIDTGRLSKVVPIGMTMDDFNGECFSGKVPLFKHFDSFDISCRPEGGIPKQSGKTGRKDRYRRYNENKKLQKEMNCSGSGNGLNVVKSKKTGEVFFFV